MKMKLKNQAGRDILPGVGKSRQNTKKSRKINLLLMSMQVELRILLIKEYKHGEIKDAPEKLRHSHIGIA